MKINNILGEFARPNPHLKRLPGVAICGNGNIAIFIKIKKVEVAGFYFLSPIDYYSNFYLLDVSEKEIVKVFESDDDNNLLRSPLLPMSAGILDLGSLQLKYSDISGEDFLKFKKLFDLYQIAKTNETFNIIYNYCNSLLQ